MLTLFNSLRSRWQLSLVAFFALTVVVVRAAHQSVQIDEAFAYLNYVWQSKPTYWTANSANHVLYSMLEVLFVQAFHPNAFTIRLPAIIGALVYIRIAVAFCQRYIRNTPLAIASLACLLLNPFVQDYLVIARGYSLALAFLMAALLGQL
jgi:hypothetical protein